MEYKESEILRKRAEYERQKYSSPETGMYICGDIVEFKKVRLFDDRIEMMIPADFLEMPVQFQKIKYPSEYRPKIILTSMDMNVNIGLTMFAKKADTEELKETVNSMESVIRKVYPDYRFFRSGKDCKGKIPYGWFDFRSYALDDAVYNLHFAALADRKILQGSFNCLYRDAEDWKRAVLQMLGSMEWIGGEQNEGRKDCHRTI